jgi:hypothetical protein
MGEAPVAARTPVDRDRAAPLRAALIVAAPHFTHVPFRIRENPLEPTPLAPATRPRSIGQGLVDAGDDRCSTRSMRLPALVVAAVLLAPATASAQRVEDTYFNSIIPSRVDHLIGFTPTTFAMYPPGQRVVPIEVRVGGRTHRYVFGNAAAAVGPSAGIYMRNMIRGRRYPSAQGIFLDRRLTAAERRHVRVRADLGRDADALAVGRGHPACAAGVSRSVARGIAAGRVRTWSAAGVPTPASGDAIALRRAGDGVDRFVEPRFGAGARLPKGARAAHDGGLSEAASGSLAVAAVTSWSRARAFQQTTCAVPVGGAAPTDASVRELSHPDAYPISFVTLRRLRGVRPIVAAFLQYLTGSQAATSFRRRGMLLVGEMWPPIPGAPEDPPLTAPAG